MTNISDVVYCLGSKGSYSMKMAYVDNMSLIPNLKNHSKHLLFHVILIQLCSMCDSLFCGYVADEFNYICVCYDWYDWYGHDEYN